MILFNVVVVFKNVYVFGVMYGIFGWYVEKNMFFGFVLCNVCMIIFIVFLNDVLIVMFGINILVGILYLYEIIIKKIFIIVVINNEIMFFS